MLHNLLVYYLLDYYEMLIYDLYQKLYIFIDLQTYSFSVMVAVSLMLFGLLTSFTPCFISLLPLTMSYVGSKYKSYINKNCFVLGFIGSFLLMIFLSHFVSFYSFFKKIPLLSSFFLLLISLNLLQIVDLMPLLYFFYPKNLLLLKYNITLESCITGFLIGITTIPCNASSIFIVVWALNHASKVFDFVVYLAMYFLGCFLPLLIIVFNANNMNFNLRLKNSYILSFINEIVFSFGSSLIFIFSLLSLLKKIYF